MIHDMPTHVLNTDKVQVHLHEYNRHDEVFTCEEVRKWLKMARAATEVETPCLSRQIGVVVADPHTGAQVSSGHNGPPDGTPRCDNEDYLKNVVWPQLTDKEKLYALHHAPKSETHVTADGHLDMFLKNYAYCGSCPRRIVGAPSGERLELCTCAHGETNAIVRAHRSVAGCWMFCWCGVPCIECSKLILNARIRVVVALDHGGADYSPHSSRWLYKKGRTDLILVKPEWVT